MHASVQRWVRNNADGHCNDAQMSKRLDRHSWLGWNVCRKIVREWNLQHVRHHKCHHWCRLLKLQRAQHWPDLHSNLPPRVGHICHWLGDHGFLRVGRVVQRFADNPDFMLPAQVHKYCAYQRANRCRLLELRQQIHWGDLRANLLCRFRHPDGCFVFCSHVQL